MMGWALTGYADTTTTAAAWDAIFRHFNGGAAYQPGEKVFIKINLTTSNSPNCDPNSSYNWNPSTCGASWTSIGQSPQLMVALLDQLVNVAGVAQSDITIGDSTGLWVNELYNILHSSFPNVVYMDARGTLGRTKSTRSTVPLYWSAPAGEMPQEPGLPPAGRGRRQVHDQLRHPQEPRAQRHHRDGQEPFRLAQRRQQPTPRKPTTTGYYNLHLRLPLDDGRDGVAAAGQHGPVPAAGGPERPRGHGRQDAALPARRHLHRQEAGPGTPSKWGVLPFRRWHTTNWPASLFLSMDQVAIDSVAFDFLSQQWPEEVSARRGAGLST